MDLPCLERVHHHHHQQQQQQQQRCLVSYLMIKRSQICGTQIRGGQTVFRENDKICKLYFEEKNIYNANL